MNAADRVHAEGRALNFALGKAYCGRTAKETTVNRDEVSCVDCLAAIRADEEKR